MNFPHFLFLYFLAVVLFGCDGPANTTPEERLPNLLIVLSDQHSYDMLGSYGNDQVISPNLDRFAAEGMRLTHAFANQPVCTPFRGMVMSGMQPLKNGAFVNDVPLLPNQSRLLPQLLKERGYQTAYVGKWHLLGGNRKRPIPEGPLRYGFDRVWTNNCHVDFRPGKAFFWNDEGEREFFDKWEVYGQTDQALAYLDTVSTDRPFALVVSWHPPHDWGKFEGEDGKMHYRYDSMEELMALYDRDTLRLRPGLEDTPDRRRMYHGYLAQVSGVDRAFGMLMDKLAEKGFEKNTLALFSADHGDMLESHDALLPKQYPHDYSTRLPFLFRMPGTIPAGSTSDVLFGTLDILPTVLGFMGVETEQTFDGADLSTALLTNDTEAVDFLPLWCYRRGVARNQNWRGIVTPDYTFARGRDSADISPLTTVLFDRKRDPHQLNNLYDNPEHRGVRDSLERLTYQWMNHYGDRFYGAEDFIRLQSAKAWETNYEKSPLQHFAEHGERLGIDLSVGGFPIREE